MKRKPSANDIIRTACASAGCDLSDFYGKGRPRATVARSLAAAMLRDLRGMSYPEIGRELGRAHSTAMYAYKCAYTKHADLLRSATEELLSFRSRVRNRRGAGAPDTEGSVQVSADGLEQPSTRQRRRDSS